ncbi:pyridoxal-5'-phosphate-dependent protein [Candidatus Geothermarchaeota archaeon]|nr:MAG: pyridoxal-5'-phosphate-dependent protein [Candidatus Geothermarchaeota archaeon]
MKSKFIPISKPWVGEDEIRAIKEQILKCNLTNASAEGGEAVREFERLISAYTGAKHAIAMNSGTSAILASLMALGIKKGDEVIVPSFTFLSTVNTVLMVGAKPVFADITLDNYGLNPDDVKRKITRKTKAVILVHLYGYPAYVDEIKELTEEHGLYLIEDSAQALGSKFKGKQVGVFGIVGCFSTYPSKIITTGEGGFVITDDDELAWKLRVIRTHGQERLYESKILGLNLRMPELLAAMGIVQMKKLDRILSLRRNIAEKYNKELSGLGLILPKERKNAVFNWNYYTVRIIKKNRDEILQILNEKGIGATVYYRRPVHHSPIYKRLGYDVKLRNTEIACRTVLSLPIYPGLTNRQVDYVIRVFKSTLIANRPI